MEGLEFGHIWKKPSDQLLIYVNGKRIIDDNVEPETSLLVYLRTKLRLTGTKLGCGEGGCGACTVMVSKYDENSQAVRHYAVNSCLAPLVSMHGCSVTTVEGIGSTKTKLHAVQERLAKFHGSQCGFCTPGIVMSMYALLRNNALPSSMDIERALQGNLCRCTGYRPILSAFNTFARSPGCPMGDKCCKNQTQSSEDCGENGGDAGQDPHDPVKVNFTEYDPTQEIIFPPELLLIKSVCTRPLKFVGERVTWYRPTTLEQLTDLKENFPGAHIVVGNTEVGIETWVKGKCFPVVVNPMGVHDLTQFTETDSYLTIGASCTLTSIHTELANIVGRRESNQTQPLSAILEMVHWFAGDQIRNVAVLGGNVMTASPISDLNPILMCCNSVATFAHHSNGEREVVMDQSFFPKYRTTCAKDGEVLKSITIPFTQPNEYMKAYMQSRRREDDIAIVNGAFRVHFYPQTCKVKTFSAAFGGMAATSVMPKTTMKNILERSWDDKLVEDVTVWMSEDLPLRLDAPGGMVEYREALAASFFFKFYIFVKDQLHKAGILKESILESERCTMVPLGGDYHGSIGTQTFQEVPQDQPLDDAVGRSVKHVAADKQVTGEAVYIDDIPPYNNELYLCLVVSKRAHAHIRDVNIDKAMTSPGVVTYVDKNDVIGTNNVGMMGNDTVFADGKVTAVGHVIGAVVADTAAHARRAALLVEVTYEDITPILISIEDAIKHESYFEPVSRIVNGNAEVAMTTSDVVVEAEIKMAGQEHFYLETQVSLAVPKGEDGEMEIFSSTQDPGELQRMAAEVLDVELNKVVVKVKRMGGGFGGKQSRFLVLSNPVAVAARKTGRPVRCMLTRQDDMLITGQRHPFYAKYKVSAMKDGRIVALINDIYSNAGNTHDLSFEVMERALFTLDNCYNIPNVSFRGIMCKTNISSNSAFRGFGGPQGMFIMEEIITRVASQLNMPTEKVRDINMYKDGDLTHFNQRLDSFLARRCFDECLERSNFLEKREEIKKYNTENRWRKQGIACVPVKHGISFSLLCMNQAGALVHIYKDGSVLLTHGGTEMGQGLHTKMIQVASRCLGVPLDRIHICETSTNTVPNTQPTAASAGSDLNGMAVKAACDEIMKRLEPLREANKELSWNELIMKGYTERINLSVAGHYKTPDLGFTWDKETGHVEGRMYNYFTYGAAVSHVEIDCLTGDHIVLQSDIVMDIGKSLNPAIDIGQIEGGFMQGLGLFTIEEPMLTPSGQLITQGPGTYKIPGFGDCPKQMNVHLLRSKPHERAIYSSKAIGEPSLPLAASAFFAIKDAISSARLDAKLEAGFRLDSPATVERIRINCGDLFVEQHYKHAEKNEKQKLQRWAIQA